MTNNVTIKAPDHNHGAVVVKITGQPDLNLLPGQETTSSVYPGKTISIDEAVMTSGTEQSPAPEQPADETAGTEGTAAAAADNAGDEQAAS